MYSWFAINYTVSFYGLLKHQSNKLNWWGSYAISCKHIEGRKHSNMHMFWVYYCHPSSPQWRQVTILIVSTKALDKTVLKQQVRKQASNGRIKVWHMCSIKTCSLNVAKMVKRVYKKIKNKKKCSASGSQAFELHFYISLPFNLSWLL